MAVFPSLIPATRVFSPGQYPVAAIEALNGAEGNVRLSTTMVESRLRLRFVALSEAEMLSVLAHYMGQRGGFDAFSLPVEVFSGTDDPANFQLAGYFWRYAESPTVEDYPCDSLHDVELSLVTVPPARIELLPFSATIGVSIVPGVAAAANGITATINVTLLPGRPAVIVALPSVVAVVELDFPVPT